MGHTKHFSCIYCVKIIFEVVLTGILLPVSITKCLFSKHMINMKPDDLSMNTEVPLEQKINLETARISWHELQPYFARGNCIYIAPELDLVTIAHKIATDDSAAIALLIQEGKISKVSDIMAQQFFDNNQSMWAVVVKPYVLVQPE